MMKVLKQSLVVLLAVLLLTGFTGLDAAKKRKIDSLKFPPLNKIIRPELLKTETANGIKLRLIKDETLPIIELRILVKGGNAFDPADKVGLAAVTAQLLRIGGTADLKPEDIDKLLDSKGITISLSTGDDYYTINLSCLKDNIDEAVSILAKMLRSPAFDKEKMEEYKGQLSSSISRRNDNPGPINNREFARLIYGDKSPFAPVLEYEHLDNIDETDIVRAYKQFFAPDNMLAGATGPIELNELKSIFEKHFNGWSHQAHIPPYPSVQPVSHDFKVAFAQKSNLNQSYFTIGHLGVKYDQANAAKFKVFNSIFSSGFSSRLMNRVRVKMGLTYGIGGGIRTEYLYPGATAYATFTKSESTIKAIKAIQDEINTIRTEKVTQQELDEAKEAFLNSYVFEFSSPDKVLLTRLQREFYGIDENIADMLVEDVKKVTADDVLEVAQNYLHPDKMIICVVGNKEKLDGDLSELGTVKELDISIKPPVLKEKIPEATPESLAKGAKIFADLAAQKYKGYKKLKSLEAAISMSLTMQGRTFEMNIKSIQLFPDKSHSEVTIMGMKMERTINGNKGISKQMGQTGPVQEDEIKKERFSDLYYIINNRDKYKIQYLYDKEIDGKKYDVLYIFDESKNWVKYFVNKETGLIEIEEEVSKFPGQSGVAHTVKSDFKTVNGIPFAFKSVVTVKDTKVSEMTFTEIKVNTTVDPAIFKID
jgi:zinc protease